MEITSVLLNLIGKEIQMHGLDYELWFCGWWQVVDFMHVQLFARPVETFYLTTLLPRFPFVLLYITHYVESGGEVFLQGGHEVKKLKMGRCNQ